MSCPRLSANGFAHDAYLDQGLLPMAELQEAAYRQIDLCRKHDRNEPPGFVCKANGRETLDRYVGVVTLNVMPNGDKGICR